MTERSISMAIMHQTGTNHSAGFAALPLLLVMAAAVVIVGGGGAFTYQLQKNHKAEQLALHQELKALQEQRLTSTPDPTVAAEPSLTPSPSPSRQATQVPKPAVKAATTVAATAPTAIPTATPDAVDVPLVVEQEFTQVFGRAPTAAETDFWKTRMRNNSYTRSAVRLAMQSEKKKNDEAAEAEQLAAEAEKHTQVQATQNLLLKDSQCKVLAQQWSDVYTSTTAPYFKSNPGFVVSEAARLYQRKYNECMSG